MNPDTLAVLVRAALFVALFQAVGTVLFLVLFGRMAGQGAESTARHARTMALLAMGLVIVHLALQAARMTGSLDSLGDFALHAEVLASPFGSAHVLQFLGLGFVAVGAGSTRPLARAASVAGACVTLGAFLLVGHTSALTSRWVAGLLLLLHLGVVAFWFGSLWPLRELVRKASAEIAGRELRRYSAVATALVPLIAAAGLVLALRVASGVPDAELPYTRLLMGKIAGFALLMGLASWNKWRLVPALERGEARAARQLERSLSMELVLIAMVLCATAVMTSWYSPH